MACVWLEVQAGLLIHS